MSFIGKAVGKIVGGITGANDQADAARDAAATQAAAAQQGAARQDAALAQFQQTMAPFVDAGLGALGAQQGLLGLNGAGAQQVAIAGIQASPQYQALSQSGQDAILANASATGGLRGGNVQAALGQFQPALLSSLIDQQYSRLGGLTTLGQNSAAGVGAAQMNTGTNVANLLQQQGAATAGGQIAAGNATANGFNSLLGLGGTIAGMGGFSGLGSMFGGGSSVAANGLATTGSAGGLLSASSLGSASIPSIPMLSKF